MTYKKLSRRVAQDLNAQMGTLRNSLSEISQNFRNIGLETSVWYPEKIHSANLGGVNAESYIGYSRIEGRWGLVIRTIEREPASGDFISQRVFSIETCGNMEIIANGLKKVCELAASIKETTERQIKILETLDGDIDALRDPEFKF